MWIYQLDSWMLFPWAHVRTLLFMIYLRVFLVESPCPLIMWQILFFRAWFSCTCEKNVNDPTYKRTGGTKNILPLLTMLCIGVTVNLNWCATHKGHFVMPWLSSSNRSHCLRHFRGFFTLLTCFSLFNLTDCITLVWFSWLKLKIHIKGLNFTIKHLWY